MNEIEHIQQFIEGKLSGDALQAFELKLEKDYLFREKVEDYKAIFGGLKQLRHENFEARFKSWNKELPAVTTPRKLVLKHLLPRVAAAAIALTLVILAYWVYQSSESLMTFADQHYTPIKLSIVRAAADSSDYLMAERHFQNEDYESSIQLLNKFSPTDSLYFASLYLKEHNYFKSQQYRDAINTYEQIEQLKLKGQTAIPVNYDPYIAEWTAILAQLAIYQSEETPVEKQNLVQRIDTFLQKDIRDDYYIKKAKKLKSLLKWDWF